MQTVSCATMREMDRQTIAAGTPGEVLMDRAGLAVANAADFFANTRVCSGAPPWILLIAGHGNNGGDVFAAARHLKARGRQVEVWLAASISQVKGDAGIHLERMLAAGIHLREMPDEAAWNEVCDWLHPPVVIVDGLLGSGIKGAPRGVAAAAIEFINRRHIHSRVVAVDVPSGLNADDGTTAGAAVRADFTITMALPKTGMLLPEALDFIGGLAVADIGIPPPELTPPTTGLDAPPELITPADLSCLAQRRPRATHKGTYGHVLLIAGAHGFTGAAIMAARAALRSGAGLVTVWTPCGIRAEVAGAAPGAMVRGLPEDNNGAIADIDDKWRAQLKDAEKFSAVLAGPGLTTNPGIAKITAELLRIYPGPLVLDADALNVLALTPDYPALLRARQGATILTPHPGELARMLQTTSAAIQTDRFAAARTAVQRFNAIVTLKGGGTLVAAPDTPLQVNLTGNAGMAKGGSGDVLAGLLAGLLAQGIAPFISAKAAVHLHGRAGDYAAIKYTEPGLSAPDIIDCLPCAWAELSVR